MSKTFRWFGKCNVDYNPNWMTHESKIVRIDTHRSSRHTNKLNIKNNRDVEIESKTRGWITW